MTWIEIKFLVRAYKMINSYKETGYFFFSIRKPHKMNAVSFNLFQPILF